MVESRRCRNANAFVAVLLLLAFVTVLAACVPPLPLKKRTKSMAGVDLKVDVQAIKPGVSTREQVRAMLASTMIEETKGRFWARYFESRSSDPGGNRDWGAKNVFVSFDAPGVVESVRLVKDHELPAELRDWGASESMATLTVLDAKAYILFFYRSHNVQLSIAADGVSVVDHDATPEFRAKLPTENLKKISVDSSYGELPSNVFLNLSIDDIEGKRRTLQTTLTPQQLREWIFFLQKHYPNAEYQ